MKNRDVYKRQGSESGSGSGSGSESGSGSGSGSESGSGSGETKLVLRDHVSSEADKAATSGAGTKEDDSLIFTLTKNGTISGAFVKKLISEGKYAEFRSYKSEESKNPIATFELSPDTKVNVYDNDNYTCLLYTSPRLCKSSCRSCAITDSEESRKFCLKFVA